jgi:hypothetical protein
LPYCISTLVQTARHVNIGKSFSGGQASDVILLEPYSAGQGF